MDLKTKKNRLVIDR